MDGKIRIVVNTDGTCCQRSGLMGIGIFIKQISPENKVLADISETVGKGTNNKAAYLAVIKALEWVLSSDIKPCSIILRSGSQLVIYQLTGEYTIDKPDVEVLNYRVSKLIDKLKCTINFEWIKKEKNKEANTLASKAINMSQSIIGENKIIEFKTNSNFIQQKSSLDNLPVCKCAPDILKLNNLGEKSKFNDIILLKPKGIDGYSKRDLNFFKECVEIRFGKELVTWMENVTEETSEYTISAFKWAARGLLPNLALKKASIEEDMANNHGGVHKRTENTKITYVKES